MAKIRLYALAALITLFVFVAKKAFDKELNSNERKCKNICEHVLKNEK